MHLSYSKIKTYLDCPLKFKLTYVDRVPRKGKPYLRFSYILHHTLSRYHFYHRKNLRGLLEYYKKISPTLMERNQKLYEEGKRILVDFYQDCQDAGLYKVEEKFKVPVGLHLLSGKIDRVDRIDGGYEIIDYKTGKSIPSEERIRDSLQLKVYSAGFFKLTEQVPLRATLYFLRYRKKLSFAPAQEDIHHTTNLICSVAERMQEGYFVAKEGGHCRRCDYEKRCPAKGKMAPSKKQKNTEQLIFSF